VAPWFVGVVVDPVGVVRPRVTLFAAPGSIARAKTFTSTLRFCLRAARVLLSESGATPTPRT
jgi:hypothetical protein